MNKIHRLIGVAFIAVSLFSAVLLSISLKNYVDVTEARSIIPGHIHVSEIRIPTIPDESHDVTVQVFYNITNPSKLTILITSIEYSFYMDNKSDPRTLDEKLDDSWVDMGQFTLPKERAYALRPGESITIPVNMTVDGDTVFISRLNNTRDGKYHPVLFTTVRYTYEHIEITEVVRRVPYLEGWTKGIDPYDS